MTDSTTDSTTLRPLCIAMVAGEASGDILGAGLVQEIKRHYPDAYCYGIGGSLMQAQGFESLFPMERLSVMGLIEVLGRLFELLGIRRQLRNRLLADRPDVFIGIDAPDFNLALEKNLKSAGISTVHYVSPQVWAWRERRLKKIIQSVDHMLAVLPFEVPYYEKHNVPATFVGHPLADKIPMQPDQSAARQQLGIQEDAYPVIALMPGSRKFEVGYLGELFLATAQQLLQHYPNAQFFVPCANAHRRAEIEAQLQQFPDLPVTLCDGQSHTIMTAADAILVASGTAVLEAALHKKPIVVAYKIKPLTYAIVSRLIKVKHVTLPNLLAKKPMIPELLQHEATVDNLYQAMRKALDDKTYQNEMVQGFVEIHQQLQQDASHLAFEAVDALIKAKRSE